MHLHCNTMHVSCTVPSVTVLVDSSVDWSVVESWLAAKSVAYGQVTAIEQIGGGTQNLMFRFRCGDAELVLRRGPRHPRPRTNDALRREARVLSAIAGSGVPIPQLIAAEPDESVLGSAFYVMDPVDGFNASVSLPPLHASNAEIRRAMGFHAVDALLALGAVDAEQVGLGDLGRPEGFLERQVPQWLSTLDKYEALDGYPGHSLPNIDELADWLTQYRPPTFLPGIMHGDFHMANLMFRNDGPQVAAIVDWEMCTLGDPLLDLGWLLATWPQDGAIGVSSNVSDLPTRTELIAHYAAAAQRSVEHAPWYAVMASFKLAIVLEGTNARAHAGKAPKDVGDLLHTIAIGLLNNATVFIEEGI
ncbi:aminoglycoside phosphotransferase (APT) family kinase protein [Mycolicibacterium moriokaense]|uniref:Aminoglycoside phosphotransferase (APT) family kinase protein n=2 Tax=Mycolicibacterium moriokaense TaxID=39691 RepID=A0A318HM77_9MYCO|nr:aminoglycoside phosphotransferase (APT) family kinase protein [Mycolicibacterium moriokaense]